MIDGLTRAEAPLPARPEIVPDEILSGALLRAAEVNGWPASAALNMVSRHGSGAAGANRPALFVMGTTFDLPGTAALLDWPVDAVLATTLSEPLTRIFGVANARCFGRMPRFRICPQCVREQRLIGRETIFPFLRGCTRHHVRFVDTCSCGARLAPFSQERNPFACPDPGCQRRWETLEAQPLEPCEDLRGRRIAHAYKVLLERGDHTLLAFVRTAQWLDGPLRWDGGWASVDDELESVAMAARRGVHSIAGLVASLVAREIPPERLFEIGPPVIDENLKCRNRKCPAHGSQWSMRQNGSRRGLAESYCAECGSRFLGDRTILSFDFENGSDISEIAVQRARARLATFHERVAGACDRLSERGVPLHIGLVFREACIPNAGYLRAHRLGLVAAIKSRMGDQVKRDDACLLPDPSGRWSSRMRLLDNNGRMQLRQWTTSHDLSTDG
jgi:hypothetical protein